MLHRTSKKLNCSRSRDALLVLTGVRRHPSSVYKSSSVTGGPLEETSTTELRGSRSRFAYPEGIKDFEDDWTEHAEYPTIDVETHKWSVERRERHQLVLNWRKEIRDASCPEAKYLKINKWKFGYKVFQVSEDLFDYNSLQAYKYITRTHVASDHQLPSHYSSPGLTEKVEYFKEKVKEPLLDALAFELDVPRSFESDFNEFPNAIDLKKSKTIIAQINRVLLSILSREVDHLRDCKIDVEPNLEAFWQIGGIEPSWAVRQKRKGADKKELGFFKLKNTKIDDPVNSNILYKGDGLLQLRCKDPPVNIVQLTDPLCRRTPEALPDRFPHFLQAFGFRYADNWRFASTIPGHWSGDNYRCNLLGFHGRHHLLVEERTQNKYWSAKAEEEEAVLSQAMLVSFARLIGQALYHGFDHFNDLLYPFSTQTVITNGLDWSFFAYQLNTICFHQDAIEKNPKQNIIWGTKTQPIFDKEKKGQLNSEVLGNILRFYLIEPRPIEAENITPYLGQRIQDYEDEKERVMTFFNFRRQISQVIYKEDSLRRYRPPEMYEWERIYKFQFKTMPLERRLRWFEFPPGFPGSNPWIESYEMIDPLKESKGVRRLKQEVAAKKEEERIEAAKMEERLKHGVVGPAVSRKRKGKK